MLRVKRDIESRRARELEKAEVERRRNMTEEERQREDEYVLLFQSIFLFEILKFEILNQF
jgi:hypothetical protein